MTIAIGVLCDNGVVLGCDLQHSTDIIKTAGPKLFIIPPGKNHSVLITGAGNSDSMKKAAQLIHDRISDADDSGGISDVYAMRGHIEAALEELYSKYIYFAPQEHCSTLDVSLLLAIRVNTETALFRTNRNMLIAEDRYACVGMGMYLGHYALSTMLGWRPPVEVAAQVVTYIVSQAKEYIEGVGKGSAVQMLHADGLHDSLLLPDRDEVEEMFQEFYEGVRTIIASTDKDMVMDAWLSDHFDRLHLTVKKLRSAQQKRKKWRAHREACSEAMRAGKPAPPPPTDD